MKPKHNLIEIKTEADWILDPNGLDLFKTNNEFLLKRGISVPEIYTLDNSRTVCDYDFAFVEYIDSGNFSEYTQQYGADVSKALLKKVSFLLKKMHAIQRPYPGLLMDKRPSGWRCENMVLENALLGLDLASDFNAKIKENRNQIQDALRYLLETIEPRSIFCLIHSELGPEHILINKTLEVYFVDYEGIKFFDLEYEHSLLNARFGRDYHQFVRQDLDPTRMKYYRLIH